MARLPWRRALTTMALGLLVFLPAFAPRADVLWGRATVVNASGTAVINHDRSTLIIGSQYGDPQNLDPIATFLLSWGMMGSNIFDALVYRGPDLQIHKDMGLATGWHYLNDNTLRFTLRKGVTFQDGEPFNAAAVKFTFDRLLGPLGQKGAQYFQYKTIEEVRVVNPYTVDVITRSPDPVLITKLAGYGAMIVPPGYIKQHGDKYFASHPVSFENVVNDVFGQLGIPQN